MKQTKTSNRSSCFEVPPNAEMTDEYRQGTLAFMDGFSSDDCPYANGHSTSNLRMKWMSGFYGERVRQFLLRFNCKHKV